MPPDGGLPLVCAAALAASASDFFLASLARRLRSPAFCQTPRGRGSLLLRALFWGDQPSHGQGPGVGAVTGVSSGIVSSGCVAIVYTVGFKICKVRVTLLQDCCEIRVRLANHIKAFEWVTFTISAGVCGCWRVIQGYQVWLLRLFLKLYVFGCDESCIGQC